MDEVTGTAGVILGFFMPLVIEIVNKVLGASSRWVKYLVTLASCLVGGLVIAYFGDEGIAGKTILEITLIVFGLSQTVYNLYWKDSTLQKRLNGSK